MTATTMPLLLGEEPVGAVKVSAPARLVDTEAAVAAVQDVATTGYAELDPAYADLEERLAKAEVEAGVLLPIEPDNIVDGWMLAAVDQRAAALAAAADDVKKAAARLTEREEAFALCAAPPSTPKRLLRALGLGAMTGFASIAVGSFLVGGADTYLFRNHFVEVLGSEAGKKASIAMAAGASVLIAFIILATPIVATYLRHGAVPLWFKIVAVASELGFAAAFTLIRLEDGSFRESLSAGILELSVFVITSALPFAVAGGFAEERGRTLAWREARRARDLAQANKTEAESVRDAAKRALTAQTKVVEERDLAARKRAAWAELSIATRIHAYVTAVAAAQSAIARTSEKNHSVWVERVRGHVADEAKRAEKRLEDEE